MSPYVGWRENVTVARTSTSRRIVSDPGTLVTANGAAGPISVAIHRAGDRPGELVVLDTQPMHPRPEPVGPRELFELSDPLPVSLRVGAARTPLAAARAPAAFTRRPA